MKRPRKDPPLRSDGGCAVCEKPRPEIAVKNLDPFCSAVCCRAYHRTGG